MLLLAFVMLLDFPAVNASPLPQPRERPPRLHMSQDRPCAGSGSAEHRPLVAYCIVGAIRTFLNPYVYRSIKNKLMDAVSPDYRAFVVASLSCLHGSAVGNPTRQKKYVYNISHCADVSKRIGANESNTALQGVLDFLLVESSSIINDGVPTPTPQCAASSSEAYEKYTNFFHMFAKTSICYEQARQYERDHGVCFDFFVKARTDDEWLVPAPDVRSLPTDVVTVPLHWDGMGNLTHILEDHFAIVPRVLARAFFNAIDGWGACPPLQSVEERCPFPYKGYQRASGIMQSECILGHYLNAKNVSWRHHTQLRYRTLK